MQSCSICYVRKRLSSQNTKTYLLHLELFLSLQKLKMNCQQRKIGLLKNKFFFCSIFTVLEKRAWNVDSVCFQIWDSLDWVLFCCLNFFKQVFCEYHQAFKIPLSYIFILSLIPVRTRSGIVEMKRQRMLQQSAPANSGLLSVAQQSGPQNSSSVVTPQVVHRPTINQSMPQTRLNTLFVNQSQTQENKISSKLQKNLNFFFFLWKIYGYQWKSSKIMAKHLPPKSSRKFMLCSPALQTGTSD